MAWNRASRFGFTKLLMVRSLPGVRTFFTAAAIFAMALATGHSQDQERKFIDRLLRPNMELQNSSQNKRFTTFDVTKKVANNPAHVRDFAGERSAHVKSFSGTEQFPAQQFRASTFRGGDSSAHLATRTLAYSNRSLDTKAATGIRTSDNSWKSNAVRDFAGTRPYLGEGKSQKALKQQDRPLTIDEVRELLNKNK